MSEARDAASKSLIAALYEKYDDSSEEQDSSFCEIYVSVKAPGRSGEAGCWDIRLIGAEMIL